MYAVYINNENLKEEMSHSTSSADNFMRLCIDYMKKKKKVNSNEFGQKSFKLIVGVQIYWTNK